MTKTQKSDDQLFVIHRWICGLYQSETGPNMMDIVLGEDLFTYEQCQKVKYGRTQLEKAGIVDDT